MGEISPRQLSRILAINGLGRPETGLNDEVQSESWLGGAWLKCG